MHISKARAVALFLFVAVLVAVASTTYRDLIIKNSTVDSTPIGATTPSTGAFTTSTFNGAMTLANNTLFQVKDASASVQSLFRLNGSNQVELFGHPTTKQILIRPDGTNAVVTLDGATAPTGLAAFQVIGNTTNNAALVKQTNVNGTGLAIWPGSDTLAALLVVNTANNTTRHQLWGNGSATLCNGATGVYCQVSNLNVVGGIRNAGGFQHVRALGQAYTGGAGVQTSFTVPISQPDTNYTVMGCNVHDVSGSEVRILQSGAAKSTTGFTLKIEAIGAGNGTLNYDCAIVHDPV